MSNIDYIRDEHRVHLIIYHLIWCTKRRKPVLVKEIKSDCENLIRNKCEQNAWQVLELAVQPDHVHLFVRAFPTIPAYEIIKNCKGITSYILRNKYKELKKIPCLWTKTYFASTAGKVSSEIIQKYIEAQSKL
jgi:putative transposase